MSNGTWLRAVSVADVPPGEMKAVQIGGASIAVYHVDGDFYATSNICTHATAFLTEGWLEGTLIECPLHAGTFDITTGKGQGAPISCDLQTFPVRVANDDVEIYVE